MLDWQPLVEAARKARERSYSPYSRFAVGAALLGADGAIYPGTNIENRSYGLTLCAERSAIGAALSAGVREFRALAVVTDCHPPAAPCGLCRETLAEFAGPDLPIRLVNLDGGLREFRLGELFPEIFRFDPPAVPGRP
jgi:cytidine deaminase